MQVSNKSLVVLLVAVVLVSVLGTILSLNRIEGILDLLPLTGAYGSPGATNYGATNITVQSSLEINFSDDEVNFSSGRVKAGSTGCQIGTEGQNSSGCQGFRVPTGGLILENTGNVYARINLTNTNYSTSLFKDIVGGYAIKIQVPESAAAPGEFALNSTTCQISTPLNLSDTSDLGGPSGSGNFTGTMYTNLTIDNYPGNRTGGKVLCTIFNFTDTNDIINISIVMFITSATPATPSGGAADVWTATAL